MLPDPQERPTLTVSEAGALFGLGRSKSYDEARRYLRTGGTEGLPVLEFGRSLRVPTAKLLTLLGLGEQREDAAPKGGAPTASIVSLPAATSRSRRGHQR
jgi:hypothetical protein